MMVLLAIACAVFGIGFFAVLIKLLSAKRDLRKISQKLTDITQTDTNSRLTTDTFDKDISALIQAINRMLQNNRQGFLEVQRTETALKRAITNISHDLRTPLTSARGYLQMAEKGQADRDALARYHGIIHGRLDELTTLMDSLFAFSRAVEGNITLTRVNIGNTLRETLVGNFAEIEAKGFTVEDNIPDTLVYSLCDEDALKRVVQNLISNATTHGKDYLRVHLTDGVIEIANKVEDMYRLDVDNIFERFYTADTSRTSKRTGLGLAIAKELTEKMGGSIFAQKDGNMLVVSVKLPLCC